jgi:1,4-dihydroxy-2-naphthoyl-CoA hydrolase
LKPYLSQRCGNLVALNRAHRDCMPGFLDIRITAVGPDFVRAEMPVDQRTTQPLGLLHGGASVVLAESIGSLASWLAVADMPGVRVAGIEVNASHLKAVGAGKVFAVCRPLRMGRSLHFWRIDICDGQGDRCCSARLTVSIGHPPADAVLC